MPLEWHGDDLVRRVRRAAAEALNETVDDARDDARVTHTWKDDPEPHTLKDGRKVDTHLERQIATAHTPADGHSDELVASVGFTERDGFYGLFQEDGTEHQHVFPALRPAADRHFPTLARRIREKFAASSSPTSLAGRIGDEHE